MSASQPVAVGGGDTVQQQTHAEMLRLDGEYRARLKAEFNGRFPSWSASRALAHLKKTCPRLYQLRYREEGDPPSDND